MNSVTGKVVAVSGRKASVKLASAVVCPRCAAGRGCGAGLFGGSAKASELHVEMPADVSFRTGDPVTLSLSGTYLVQASLLAYGLPLAGALLTILIGQLFAAPLTDLSGVILGIAGLASGILLSRKFLHGFSCLQRFVPLVSSPRDAS
jgi:sigma-E factor negative regulatory protein RseC